MRTPPHDRPIAVALATLLTLAVACRAPDVPRVQEARRANGLRDPATGAGVGAGAAAPHTPLVATQGDEEKRPLVVFLGDSLTAGLGLAVDEAYPADVERLMASRGFPIRAVNAGVSGDTTAGGLERVDRLLARRPAVVVVEFGANDGLRGQPVDGIESNLHEIVRRAQGGGARVLVAGMRMPPNYGPEYTEPFAALYPAVARETGATLLPFLLEGVAGDPALNQADGIHPTAEGQRRVAENVATVLLPMLRDLAARRVPG